MCLATLTKWLISTQHAQCVLLFLVLVGNSDWFQILRSHMLLLNCNLPVALIGLCFSTAEDPPLSQEVPHVLQLSQAGEADGRVFVWWKQATKIQV